MTPVLGDVYGCALVRSGEHQRKQHPTRKAEASSRLVCELVEGLGWTLAARLADVDAAGGFCRVGGSPDGPARKGRHGGEMEEAKGRSCAEQGVRLLEANDERPAPGLFLWDAVGERFL